MCVIFFAYMYKSTLGASNAHSGQQTASDTVELELQACWKSNVGSLKTLLTVKSVPYFLYSLDFIYLS